MYRKIEGVVAAMVTPLQRKSAMINVEETKRLIGFLLDKGIDGLFILGTTGEGLLLPVEDRKRFMEIVIEYVDGRVPVIVHASHMEQPILNGLIRHAQNFGASGVALLPPLFYRLQEDEIENYFRKVLDTFTDCSFFLYDIPQLADNRITPSIVENLTRSHQNLVGIKTSNPNFLDFQKFLLLKNKLTIFIGCDNLICSALLLGAQGVVSGPSSIFPEIYVLLYKVFRDNNYKIFRECQLIINEIVDLLQGGDNLVFFERTLQARGFDIEIMRPSLFDSGIPKKVHYSALVRDFLKNRYSKVLENLSSMV